jgi:hypothetical protein
MKKFICAAFFLFATFGPLFAQPSFPTREMPPAGGATGRYVWVPETNSLPRFDLDFPGGTPEQLVKAIEKATGKPLNAVVPDDCKNLKIAGFSVKGVTVAQLFEALKQASKKTERFMVDRPDINWSFEERTLMYGFETLGVPDENSIWYFNRDGEPAPYKTVPTTVCRFYQLAPYLDAGYKVDDIRSAVETAWKMLGDTNPPALSYQKDTKILIETGELHEVGLVGDVLAQLHTEKLKDMSKN